MIEIVIRRGHRAFIDPNKIDILHSSDKYLCVYTEGKQILHTESVTEIMSKYPDIFILLKRGLAVNKNFIKSISGKGYTDRYVLPVKNYSGYPSALQVSRRRVIPVERVLWKMKNEARFKI